MPVCLTVYDFVFVQAAKVVLVKGNYLEMVLVVVAGMVVKVVWAVIMTVA